MPKPISAPVTAVAIALAGALSLSACGHQPPATFPSDAAKDAYDGCLGDAARDASLKFVTNAYGPRITQVWDTARTPSVYIGTIEANLNNPDDYKVTTAFDKSPLNASIADNPLYGGIWAAAGASSRCYADVRKKFNFGLKR